MLATTKTRSKVSGLLYEDRAAGFAPLSQGSSRVERREGLIIVRGVKVVSRESKNTHGVTGVTEGTRYTETALRQELPLLEGVRVNLNHPPPDKRRPGQFDRPAEDRLGKLENVHLYEGEPYADLVMLASHPMAERIANAADSMPDAFALSHNARGDGPVVDGWWVIETINFVKSVDVVADGGTNKSLFESEQTMNKVKKPLKEWCEVNPQLGEKLSVLLESSPMLGTLLIEGEDGGGDYRDHLHMAKKMCEDAGDHEMAGKIHRLMKPTDLEQDDPDSSDHETGRVGDKEGVTKKVDTKPDTPDDGGDPAKHVKAKAGVESRLEELEKKDSCRTLCESMNFIPRPEQLRALMGVNVADRKELIKGWRDSRSGTRSRSLIPEPKTVATARTPGSWQDVTESDNGIPEKDEDLLTWLRN